MSTKTLYVLDALARAFEENRLFEVAQHFSFPMATYAHDGLLVFGAPETMVEALQEYRSMALTHDIVRIEPRIVAQGLPVNRRADLWVEWDHLDKDGVCQRVSQMRLVLRNPTGSLSPTIEMVDCKVPAFPELATRLPLAMPA